MSCECAHLLLLACACAAWLGAASAQFPTNPCPLNDFTAQTKASSAACTQFPRACPLDCALAFIPLHRRCKHVFKMLYNASALRRFAGKCRAQDKLVLGARLHNLTARNCTVDMSVAFKWVGNGLYKHGHGNRRQMFASSHPSGSAHKDPCPVSVFVARFTTVTNLCCPMGSCSPEAAGFHCGKECAEAYPTFYTTCSDRLKHSFPKEFGKFEALAYQCASRPQMIAAIAGAKCGAGSGSGTGTGTGAQPSSGGSGATVSAHQTAQSQPLFRFPAQLLLFC